MWQSEYQQHMPVPAAAVWSALRALHSGQALSENSDSFVLHGPFAVGTELSVRPQGQDTFRSLIVELVENELYADRTEFDGLSLLFRHKLVATTGGTEVTHQLVIDGPAADQVGPELGPQITADFPVAMADLAAAAQRLANVS